MGERSRSLVGMSEGSKKRAARRSVALTWEEGECWDAEYQAAREAYRIGERLRPCRAIEHEGTPIYCSHCDGSGVLPARRTQGGSILRAPRPSPLEPGGGGG